MYRAIVAECRKRIGRPSTATFLGVDSSESSCCMSAFGWRSTSSSTSWNQSGQEEHVVGLDDDDGEIRAVNVEYGSDLAYGYPGSDDWKVRQHIVQSTLLDEYRRQNEGGLGFGRVFSDHMMVIRHDQGDGWGRPQITSMNSIPMHPASQVLHYGMSCFEGMKAYRNLEVPNRVQLFRPELNMQRLLSSATRLHLPPFCPDELLECIKQLVRMDKGWVPNNRGESLYIRPVLFSSSPMLGVSSPQETTLNIIMSPSGNYFAENGTLVPIRMYIEEEYRRAWPGGAGNAKVSGNYAPTIYPQAKAREQHGAHQVVFTSTDGSGTYFEECGAMNIFFVFQHRTHIEIATPPLRGTILPGVTRASIIEMVQGWSHHENLELVVEERQISVDEVVHASSKGILSEVFTCGTASIVQPVGTLIRNGPITITPSSHTTMPITKRIYNALVDIHHGSHESWIHPI